MTVSKAYYLMWFEYLEMNMKMLGNGSSIDIARLEYLRVNSICIPNKFWGMERKAR